MCIFLKKGIDIVCRGNKVRKNYFLLLSQLKAHKVNCSQRTRERERERQQNEIILFVLASAQKIFSEHACIKFSNSD